MTRRPSKAVDITFGRPVAPTGKTVLPSPSQPMAVARKLVQALYTLPDGVVLRSHRGDFYYWDGTRWLVLDRSDVRARVYEALEHATYFHDKEGWLPFAPTTHKVADVVDALHAITLTDSRRDAPLWMDRRTTLPTAELIPMQNGLLHVPTRTPAPHSALFFNHHALPFAFEPKAATPDRWLRFLGDLWEQDDASIATLQEAMGYVVGGDTRQQKILLVVGPKRAGKAFA